MVVEVTAELQRVAPAAANGVSITPSATPWADSAYAEVIASTGTAITVVGVIVNAGVAAEFELDIAKGAATSEAVVARVCNHIESLDGNDGYFCPINIPVDNIASGTRVSIRLRKSGTSVAVWRVKLVYYNTVASTVGVTANVSALVPSAADGVSVTPSATPFANSAYGELSAALTDIVCLGLAVNPGGTITAGGDEFEVDIATGSATSEVVKGTLAGEWENFAEGGPMFLRFPIPVHLSGTNRVACRMRKTGVAVTAWTFKLQYVSALGFGKAAIQSTAQPQKSFPAAATMTGSSVNVAWANSPYVELRAASGPALVIGSINIKVNTATEYEIEAATGAAASEVVVGTGGENRDSDFGIGLAQVIPVEIPIDNIAASTRVAGRHRKESTVPDLIFRHGMQYYEKPL